MLDPRRHTLGSSAAYHYRREGGFGKRLDLDRARRRSDLRSLEARRNAFAQRAVAGALEPLTDLLDFGLTLFRLEGEAGDGLRLALQLLVDLVGDALGHLELEAVVVDGADDF